MRRCPSRKAGLPLVWKRAKASPRLPNMVTSMKVGWSFQLPSASWKRRLTARPNLTMAVPLPPKRVSQSRVRLPIRMTLLKLAMSLLFLPPESFGVYVHPVPSLSTPGGEVPSALGRGDGTPQSALTSAPRVTDPLLGRVDPLASRDGQPREAPGEARSGGARAATAPARHLQRLDHPPAPGRSAPGAIARRLARRDLLLPRPAAGR